jgi:hypothetical protein
MFKKVLLIVTMLCVLPAMAHAWQLTTWVKAQGGTITSANLATPQTVLNGSVTKSYSTLTQTVTITPAPGFIISKLEKNGIVSGPFASVAPITTGPTSPGAITKVYVTFARASFTLSATAGANGAVDKASYPIVYAGFQSPTKTFTFTPAAGFAVASITPSAGVLDTDFQYVNAVTNAPLTLPAATGVKVKVNVVNVPSTSIAFAATFSGAAPVNTTDAKSKACAECHATQGVGVGVYAAFASGPHNNTKFGCRGCHVGADLGQHPGVLNPNCNVCHGTGQVAQPPTAAGQYSLYSAAHATTNASGNYAATCALCHAPGVTAAPAAVHAMGGCVSCHSIPQQEAGKVNDNSGVRAATLEFGKWSHHVTGVTLNDAHCAACHLEGKYDATVGGIVIDSTYHRAGTTTHLRNADTDADMVWDPLAPSQTTMDNFCMSCHDANGATSTASAQIQAFINSVGLAATGKTASASNPFGDTISNRYDKMQRPAVVNVNSQFNTTNNSHHGVKGPRYTGRTRDLAGPRTIASPATFANGSSATLYGARSTIYDSVNATTKISEFGTNPAFNALYVPLADTVPETAPRTGNASLGDDSTLHCGDCHTVGQWKPGVATNAAGVVNTVAIGAHGSNNEYMLRNDKGTDERHTQDAYEKNTALNVPNPGPNGFITYKNPNGANLVCFNCHSYKRYGSVYNATGATGPHAGEYDASGRCNGVGNTIPFNGYTTGTATDGTQFLSRIGELTLAQGSSTPAFAPGFPLNFANAPGGVQAATYTGEQNADFGNVFGIQCLNCHNSGVGNGYGGIHGSANNSPGTANTIAAGGYANPDPSVTGGAYVDGMGNTNKVQRFLPGLGNVMHVPGTLGGFKSTVAGPATKAKNAKFGSYSFVTGGISADTNWEQVGWKQTSAGPLAGTTSIGAGCYTLNAEGEGGSLDKPLSPTQGLKGQSFDGGATIPNAAKTWGGCDDHVGNGVGNADHGFQKRINRPVTY